MLKSKWLNSKIFDSGAPAPDLTNEEKAQLDKCLEDWRKQRTRDQEKGSKETRAED